MNGEPIVAGDIGGTNARFSLARRRPDGGIMLSDEHRLKVADHASLETAWEAFAARVEGPLPRVAAIAVAGPVEGGRIALTNNPWSIMPDATQKALGLDRLLFVNDFAAVAFAVAALGPEDLPHVAGPDRPLPDAGAITVMGPGTGLGVALLSRAADGPPRILATEGGHIDFAPLDPLEDRILAELRRQYRRVSIERLVAGPGLNNLYAALATIEGRSYRPLGDDQLWDHVAAGQDGLARAAFERWCMILGAVCGDLALAHGARAVVLGGGIVPRILAPLQASGFHARFCAKGRFEARMADMPIRRLAHAEPGLLGAAAAWFLGEGR